MLVSILEKCGHTFVHSEYRYCDSEDAVRAITGTAVKVSVLLHFGEKLLKQLQGY